jgi:hypothetical protein
LSFYWLQTMRLLFCEIYANVSSIMLTTTHMAHDHAFRIITGQPHLLRGHSLSSTCGNSLRMQNNYCLKITEYGLAAQYPTFKIRKKLNIRDCYCKFYFLMHTMINNIRVRVMVNNATFNNILSYIVAICFIDGGNRSTWRKPPTCRKSLTSFITYCCIEYTSP